MSKLHALLIAINQYAPNSGVRHLAGCVNDIKAAKNLLQTQYKGLKPSIKVLVNAAATRKNIIDSFRQHLVQKAKKGDTVLFYYSGHGSFAPTAKEFEAFDPLKQDETLVCYDSRLPDHHDLADKEIAVLLAEIPEGVHTVMIVDACHSASINRGIGEELKFGKTRFSPGRDKDTYSRSLASYLVDAGENIYQQQILSGEPIQIPRSQHILLSACSRQELAAETYGKRGLFSEILIATLEEHPDSSYADLFAKVRAKMKLKTADQVPTLTLQEGFNPNTVVLRDGLVKNHKRHAVTFVDGKWRLAYGAIHGLEQASRKQLSIGLYDALEANDLIASVPVDAVLLKESILTWAAKDTDRRFYGEIQSFPSAMYVQLEGSPTAVSAFEASYKKTASPFLLFDKNTKDTKYVLTIEAHQLSIQLNADKRLLHGVKGTDEAAVAYITSVLEQIEEWERFSTLENPNSTLPDALEVVFACEPIEGNSYETADSVITLDYPKVGKDTETNGDKKINWYSLKAKNTSSQNLYVSLLHLGTSFSAQTLFTCAAIPAKSDWISLDDQHGLLVEKDEWSEVTDVFKILVSTAPFDDYAFQKEGFELGTIHDLTAKASKKGIQKKANRKKQESDWCTKTILVNTIRQEASIQKRTVKIDQSQLTFKGHPSFQADIAFAPVHAGTRSVHPQAKLAGICQEMGLELINLAAANTRSFQDKSIIELSGIANYQVLKEQPLELLVEHQTTTDEQIIPVTFDGEFIIPFGKSSRKKGGKSTRIQLNELPAVDDVNRKRSLTKAAWFCLLKVTGFRNKAFRLRHARFNRAGELVRNRQGIRPKVEKAKKILLVIHGIIGDTKGMAENLLFLVEEGHYDLMLTYDYENLNEPIESIAQELSNRLDELGIKANDGKQLDIIAHSMGGLVSRYLIEQIRKTDQLVDRLIMFGTPNGGSPFGSIPEYIEMLNRLVTVAINFGKPFLAPLIAYIEALEKANRVLKASKYLTVTLDQMNAESAFIKALYKNTKPIHTPYTIIAADISNIPTDKEGTIGRLLLKIGDFMNNKEPNDIAVHVDQIKGVPSSFDADMYTVVGHHMNYFEEVEAMDLLRKLI